MGVDTILWRRTDTPGHDACRLIQGEAGWTLEGAAAFRHEDVSACITYQVECDGQWQTREGVVRGWVGVRSVDLRITRTPDGIWTLNGQVVPDLGMCADLDLGFTPATNLFQLRRVSLEVGQAADVPVAWLDVPVGTLDRLDQRYERRTAQVYRYEAPRFDYFELLQVNAAGFIEKYPHLWVAET